MSSTTERMLEAVEAAKGNVLTAATELGIPEATFRKRLVREGLWERVEAIREERDEVASIVKAANAETPAPIQVESLIKAHGDDPSKVTVVKSSATRYGPPEEPMHRLRVDWIPNEAVIHAPDPNSWTPPPKPKKRRKEKYLDAVVISDHHAPHHEPTFHRLFLEYLGDAQPGLIEVNGDLLDFSTISRHRERDGYAAPVNECLSAGFGILRDYREVCPDAQIRYKRGNHEERLHHLILDNAKGLHKIAPADDEVPALDLRRLLHLDELHIEYVDEEWDQAKTAISKKLTARHGFTTTKAAGHAMLDKLAGSTVQGHDHRLGLTLRTEHQTDPDDDPLRVRMGIQGGCACIIPGGLGYINGGEPDWANGCTAFRVWPDGDFHTSIGVYIGGRFLAPNGERYVA